ncbi:MAG TPA: hypothetical protein VLG11_01980 [Candidatus Saccharimonadales bacterium]|nr:hypothetical protein [Candidatus Saccharimonadales bacterium]
MSELPQGGQLEVGLVEHTPNRLTALLAAGSLAVGLMVSPTFEQSAHADTSPQVVIGMPFNGKWAYNANVDPPYTDANSSHPSVHEAYGFDWATDIYAAAGTEVDLYGTSSSGTVTFKRNSITDTCSQYGANIAGKGVVFDVRVNGTKIGEVKYDHLDLTDVGDDPINSGTKIGVVTNEALNSSCYQTRHTHMQLLNTGGNFACYSDHGHPGVTLDAKADLGVIGSTNSAGKQACAPNATAVLPPPDNLFVLQGNTLYGKTRLGDNWSTLTSAAESFQAAGQRVGIIDTAGNLKAKDGIGGQWIAEMGAIDQYVITPNLLAVRVGGTIYAKAQLTDQWTTLTSNATSLEAAGGRIAWQDTRGAIWGRDGLQGNSVVETSGAAQYAVTPNLFLVRQGTTLLGKIQLADQWSTLTNAANDVKASANRIAIIDTSGAIEAKDTLGGQWHTETTGAAQYLVTPDKLIVRQGDSLLDKSGLADQWTTLGGGIADVKAGGERVMAIDSTGKVIAKDGLDGNWSTETSGESQYGVANTQ